MQSDSTRSQPPGAEAAAGAGPSGRRASLTASSGPEGDAPDESVLFSTLLESMRGLLSLGTVSEQNKLNLEKASTLVQQIKAAEEKEQESGDDRQAESGRDAEDGRVWWRLLTRSGRNLLSER